MVESVETIIEGLKQSISFYETFARGCREMNMLQKFNDDGELILSVRAEEILKFSFMPGTDLESGTVSYSKKMTLQRQHASKIIIKDMPREVIFFEPHAQNPDWSKIPEFTCVDVVVEIPLAGPNREAVINKRLEDAAFQLFSEAHLHASRAATDSEGFKRVNWVMLKHHSVAEADVEKWTLTCVQEIC